MGLFDELIMDAMSRNIFDAMSGVQKMTHLNAVISCISLAFYLPLHIAWSAAYNSATATVL